MPSFAMKPLYETSIAKVIEHHAWSMPCSLAVAGNDIFSTLWTPIAGLLRYIAKAVRVDANNNQNTNEEVYKSIRMYLYFTLYLVNALKPSYAPI